MIDSEILQEKYRVQKKLAEESRSIPEYLTKIRLTANKVAEDYGVSLSYVQIPNVEIQPISTKKNTHES